MPVINLISADLAPKKSSIKIANALKLLAIVVFVGLFVESAIFFGLYFTYTSQISQSTAQQNQLEQSIKALEGTEQQYVLIKDRVSKISAVLGEQTSEGIFQQIGTKAVGFPEGVKLSGASINGSKAEVTISAAESRLLGIAITEFVKLEGYKKIFLTSVNYSPAVGYMVNLELSK